MWGGCGEDGEVGVGRSQRSLKGGRNEPGVLQWEHGGIWWHLSSLPLPYTHTGRPVLAFGYVTSTRLVSNGLGASLPTPPGNQARR